MFILFLEMLEMKIVFEVFREISLYNVKKFAKKKNNSDNNTY